jgi:hypothetical protein
MRYLPAAATVALLAAAPTATTAQQPSRSVIVVSYDSFNESRVTELLGPTVLPTFTALRAKAACTDGARPMFPSLTAASHAAIWTGAYGNINGIAGNRLMLAHPDSLSVTTTGDGFRFEHLNAEPAWITLGRAGRRVVALHTTQTPSTPGFPWRADRDARRADAEQVLARPNVAALNGYNERIEDARVFNEADLVPRDPTGWTGLESLPKGAPVPKELAWPLGSADSVFALLTGRNGTYDRMLITVGRRAVRGATTVIAREAAPATTNTQPLAAHFSAPVEVTAPEGRGYVRWRLFAVSADGRRFTLFQPEVATVSANRADVGDTHDAAVRGFVGNGAGYAWSRGRFGRTYRDGGDGVAEARYLETVELAVRSSIAGAEWAFKTRRPDALFTYLSVGDGVDHDTWAEALPVPPVARDTTRVNAARALRAAVWRLADRHLATLRALANARGNTAVVVSGDHGMRATWKVVRINAALAAAGLLVVDSAGRIDTRRSLAVSPAGYWINVNTTARGGPVPPDSVSAVIDRTAAALLALRDVSGASVVRGMHRPAADDSLGIGGPAGGELYWDLAEGWRATGEPRGKVLDDDRVFGGHHGFTSTDVDMRTALCLWAPGVSPRRIATGRVIDVMPTALDWLGAAPPKDATGKSLLSALLGK